MSSSTPIIHLEFQDGYYVPSAVTPTDVIYRHAETPRVRAGLSRFGAFAAPIAVAAALFAPVGPPVVRRTYSSGEGSRTQVLDAAWELDEALVVQTVRTAQSEIDELNRLFAISPSEGFWIEFPDA